MLKGAVRRQRAVSVIVNGYKRFGSPRVRIPSDWSRDKGRLWRGEAIHWKGACEVNRNPRHEHEAGKHKERDSCGKPLGQGFSTLVLTF